jgi:OOP family OmpA-OmpF porin
MKTTSYVILFVFLLVSVGCANMSQKTKCIITTATIGAGLGAGGGAASDSDGGNGQAAAIGFVAGGVLGGLGGLMMCKNVDTDGDGVPDDRDQCPNTPPGCEVDENGCAKDSDGDGVKDCVDKCPNTPPNCKPVDKNGCAKDTDGDGVKDCVDKCPNTPPNCKPVDKNGCAKDTDGDGVKDCVDKCPNTPPNCKPVDKNGCAADSDGDGVKDCIDKCPDTPKGVKVDASGCSMVGEELLIIYGITFEFNSSKLDEGSKIKLSRGVESLKKNQYIKVLIEGHTDSVGDADYNMGLSIRRAQAVRDHFVAEGVVANRMSIKGLGETDPITTNDTKEGRAQNRRVEFVVLEKKMK